MTINEIEKTLQELRARHQNLDEAMLITLLTAGGWDEAMIRDAKSIFNGTKNKKELTPNKTALPTIEQDKVLPEMADSAHTLLEHNPEVQTEKEGEKPNIEPQSLIESSPEKIHVQKLEPELPHNLSIRPFESTEKVWPFSRYKDVFHGDTFPKLKEKTEPKENIFKKNTEPETEKQNKIQIIEKHIVIDNIEISKTPLSSKDEKLVVLASTMLLIIILLLGYMYTNGRL